MTASGNSVREEALAWLVRTNDPDFQDWDVFTAWLEADPAHADAYHGLADSEIEMRSLVEQIVPRTRHSIPGRTRRYAIAAGFAVVAAAGATVMVPRLSPDSYSTGPGEQRMIELASGDQLLMNGDTRLELAGLDRRTVRLRQGEILLRLEGPGDGRVKVVSGDLELVDIGTVFNVIRRGTLTSVAVAEGAVMADPDGARLALNRGGRLDAKDGDTVLRPTNVEPSTIGAWKVGQLVYHNEPVDRVIADLSRSTGIDFVAEPDMGPQRFTGTLAVAEIRRDPRALGPLLGVSIRGSGRHWTIGGGAQD